MENFIKGVIENWYIIFALLAMICFLIDKIATFVNLPNSKQITNVAEWLKYAVTEAEAELGSGTGALKLRSVYDAAIVKFPWVAKYITFETFSVWVDDALTWMNEEIKSNDKIAALIENNEE
jgi:hypothetical protein